MRIDSLVHGVVDSARRLEGVKTRVNEVATIECAREALRSWEILGWQVLFLRHFSAILLVGCLIDQVLLEGLFWVFNFGGISGEFSWDDVLALNLLVVVFDSAIHLCVKFAMLTHFFQGLVFECSQ